MTDSDLPRILSQTQAQSVGAQVFSMSWPESVQRPSATPAHLGGGHPPPGSTSQYTRRRHEGVVPPPGAIDGQPGQPGVPAQGLSYVPMPPGPTVVQLPLFDSLMAILRVRI
ncbi:hypothetical protein OG21DRAFT_902831 [Imleria badia]|nr:hypothetical protein OG21DRAFT_902831 [Imleria badia]